MAENIVPYVVEALLLGLSDDESSDEDAAMLQLLQQPANPRPRLLHFVANVDELTNEEFRRNFRMGRDTFEYILNNIENRINLERTGRPAIDLKIKLLLAIWFLATPECYRSVCGRFDVSRGTGHNAVRMIVQHLFDLAPLYIKWPDQGNRDVILDGFQRMGFPGVLGAIDGTYIKIPMPHNHGINYICRKNFPAIILQGICDHRMLFTHCYAGEVGSTHDAQVLRRSEVWGYVTTEAEAKFPQNTHLIGDKAYPCIPQLMTPFRDNGHLTPQQQRYNFRLSRARSTIERCFGLLKGRFRCLKDTLEMTRVEWIPKTIIACCVLHNICILQGDVIAVEEVEEENMEDVPREMADRERNALGNLKRNEICEAM